MGTDSAKAKVKNVDYKSIKTKGIESEWFLSHFLALIGGIVPILIGFAIINGLGLEVGTFLRRAITIIAFYIFAPFVSYGMMMRWQRTALRSFTGLPFNEWVHWNMIALGLAGLVIFVSTQILNQPTSPYQNPVTYASAVMILLLSHFLVFRHYLPHGQKHRAYINVLFQLTLVWLVSRTLDSDIWAALLLLTGFLLIFSLPILKWTVSGINSRQEA